MGLSSEAPREAVLLKSVAILFNPEREAAVETAARVSVTIREAGIDVFTRSAWEPGLERVARDRDLAIVLGGDGTILTVGRELAGTGVPTLGVNLGHVGFLAELTPQLIDGALPAVLEGAFWVETRHVLEVNWQHNGRLHRNLALNEAAVARGLSTRAIRVGIQVDGFHYTTHTADGILVSTATGSTAYALAAGGPILYPDSADMLLTPVAPHLHIGRALVLPRTATVDLELRGDREAVLSIDGQTECPMEVGAHVQVCLSDKRALFARLGSKNYFYSVLAGRLH